jgi:hypothetical protein
MNEVNRCLEKCENQTSISSNSTRDDDLPESGMASARDDNTSSVANISSVLVSSIGSTISGGYKNEMVTCIQLEINSPNIEGCRSLPRAEACKLGFRCT